MYSHFFFEVMYHTCSVNFITLVRGQTAIHCILDHCFGQAFFHSKRQIFGFRRRKRFWQDDSIFFAIFALVSVLTILFKHLFKLKKGTLVLIYSPYNCARFVNFVNKKFTLIIVTQMEFFSLIVKLVYQELLHFREISIDSYKKI